MPCLSSITPSNSIFKWHINFNICLAIIPYMHTTIMANHAISTGCPYEVCIVCVCVPNTRRLLPQNDFILPPYLLLAPGGDGVMEVSWFSHNPIWKRKNIYTKWFNLLWTPFASSPILLAAISCTHCTTTRERNAMVMLVFIANSRINVNVICLRCGYLNEVKQMAGCVVAL